MEPKSIQRQEAVKQLFDTIGGVIREYGTEPFNWPPEVQSTMKKFLGGVETVPNFLQRITGIRKVEPVFSGEQVESLFTRPDTSGNITRQIEETRRGLERSERPYEVSKETGQPIYPTTREQRQQMAEQAVLGVKPERTPQQVAQESIDTTTALLRKIGVSEDEIKGAIEEQEVGTHRKSRALESGLVKLNTAVANGEKVSKVVGKLSPPEQVAVEPYMYRFEALEQKAQLEEERRGDKAQGIKDKKQLAEEIKAAKSAEALVKAYESYIARLEKQLDKHDNQVDTGLLPGPKYETVENMPGYMSPEQYAQYVQRIRGAATTTLGEPPIRPTTKEGQLSPEAQTIMKKHGIGQ
jgi:hypothetical protein